LGIKPTYPATCYGYLETAGRYGDDNGAAHYELARFVEKPDAATAEEYLSTGRYYWNGGMFIWSIQTIVSELERQLPEHVRLLSRAVDTDGKPEWPLALAGAFEPLEAKSIDYGVMEGAEKVRMVEARFEWNDVGGWLAMEEFMDKDRSGNAHRGRVASHDATGNLVFCEDDSETVALIGVKDMVVVRSGSTTLVVPKDRAEEIKLLVKALEKKG
jgi:mannose-1-phosphate guanylyltransferase